MDGGSGSAGRVEVEVAGGGAVWTSVCDTEWDMNDAQVVCQQLGYTAAIGAPLRAFYGESEGKISVHVSKIHTSVLCL